MHVHSACDKNLHPYTWDDQQYRDFMMGIISILEPRFEEKNEIIQRPAQEISEIYFIMEGTVDVGYEISRQAKFVLRLSLGSDVGAFNVTFN